jgi:hypothetical protein
MSLVKLPLFHLQKGRTMLLFTAGDWALGSLALTYVFSGNTILLLFQVMCSLCHQTWRTRSSTQLFKEDTVIVKITYSGKIKGTWCIQRLKVQKWALQSECLVSLFGTAGIQGEGKVTDTMSDDLLSELLATSIHAGRNRKYLLDCVNCHKIWQQKLVPGIIYIENVNTLLPLILKSYLLFIFNSNLTVWLIFLFAKSGNSTLLPACSSYCEFCPWGARLRVQVFRRLHCRCQPSQACSSSVQALCEYVVQTLLGSIPVSFARGYCW